ncbi:MAG TPA: tetratricopeptide repeat protein [Blastocatellia bacterium]|nr:tetratricopeptide repeat protein [Blastocatellia bacterium]
MSKDELGKWYLQLGLIDRGVEALHASDDVLGRLQLARALADSGKPREAIDECCTLLKRTADSEDASILARVRNELGMLLSDQGSLPEAVSQYSLAIKLDPDYADPHNNLGVVHQGQERFQDARDEFKRAIALDPELTVARYNLADLYRGLGLDELAVAQFRRLLTLDPSRSDAHYWLGIIYDKHDETDQALSHMERAVQLDLTGSARRDYLAYLYDKKERFDDALTQINHVIADDPANLRAWAFRAHLYRRLGRLGDAEVQVKAAQARKAELMTQPDGKPFEDDYQEACFEALCGKPDAALEKLAAALAAGLRTPESVRVDTDFVALRDDPRFKALVEKPGMTRTR